MESILVKISIIGAAGIAAQWAAWRLRIPAIALLLLAGLILGPALGYLSPAEDFGAVYKPAISLAVAIILFEGGLTLNFAEISETSKGLRRIILLAGPMVWVLSALSAHYAAGLDWPAAIVLGAILVVTGPTVIMPLLRQAQLSSRPASLLRWEAIVNDPIGALFAVLAFEVYLVMHGTHEGSVLLGTVLAAAVFAVGGGILIGRLVAAAFIGGHVPEYLKAPVLLSVVLVSYALSNLILEESGLLTVTVLGITLGNSRMASLTEIKRFKETITVLLVSGLFVLLTASLDVGALSSLGWGTVWFVLLILFVVRPIAVMLATIGAELNWRERLLVAWIAPRGIVAVAVSGLFGGALVEFGVEDGAQLTALAFIVVASTIVLHGFTLGPLASLMGLKSAERPGLLIVGSSQWSIGLAQKLMENDVPVFIADSNYTQLRPARLANVPTYFGEILSEAAHHDIALNQFTHLIAATNNDAYNALVCSEFGPELGRGNVFQTGTVREEGERQALNVTIGGRALFKPGKEHSELLTDLWRGWRFHSTRLTEEFDYTEYLNVQDADSRLLFWVRENNSLQFPGSNNRAEPETGDLLIAFGPKLESDSPNKNGSGT